MAKAPKGYLAMELTFHNPKVDGWESRPTGFIKFDRLTEVTLARPNKNESERLSALANERKCDAFLVKLEGRKVFLTRDVLLTQEECDEIRRQEDKVKHDKASSGRSKLALLANKDRRVGQRDVQPDHRSDKG